MLKNFDLSLVPSLDSLRELTMLGKEQLEIDKNNTACMVLDYFLADLMNEASNGRSDARLWESDVASIIREEVITNVDTEELIYMISDFLDNNTVFYVDTSYEYKDHDNDRETQLCLFLSWQESLVEKKNHKKKYKARVEEFKQKNRKKVFTKTLNPRIIKDELGNKYKKVKHNRHRKVKHVEEGFIAKPKSSTHRATRYGDDYFIITRLADRNEQDLGFFYAKMNYSLTFGYLEENEFVYYQLIN